MSLIKIFHFHSMDLIYLSILIFWRLYDGTFESAFVIPFENTKLAFRIKY